MKKKRIQHIKDVLFTQKTVGSKSQIMITPDEAKEFIGLLDWISVKDRLPEESNSVLCYNGNYILIGFLDKDFNMLDGKWVMKPRIWKDSVKGHRLEWDVTHWMYLPPTPNND